jgi:hypothetical protein
MLSNDIMDYHIVSQGKTTIPSVDDGEEMTLTDVRIFYREYTCTINSQYKSDIVASIKSFLLNVHSTRFHSTRVDMMEKFHSHD